MMRLKTNDRRIKPKQNKISSRVNGDRILKLADTTRNFGFDVLRMP